MTFLFQQTLMEHQERSRCGGDVLGGQEAAVLPTSCANLTSYPIPLGLSFPMYNMKATILFLSHGHCQS
jgi:hypothetical protein